MELTPTKSFEDYEKETGKKAIWQGKITNGYKEWASKDSEEVKEEEKEEEKEEISNQDTPEPDTDPEPEAPVRSKTDHFIGSHSMLDK